MANILLVPRVKPGDCKYDTMAALSLASYRKYLAGDWIHEEVIGANWLEMWKTVFEAAYEHWKQGNDVFVAGADTIAVSPIKVFGEYSQMVMFWYTDPAGKEPYPGYLNAELIYLPHTMPESLWSIGRVKAQEMEGKVYDESQYIWNSMYWAQDPRPDLDPTMHYSPHVSTTIKPEQAKIWHLHGSRGPDWALQEMQRLAQ